MADYGKKPKLGPESGNLFLRAVKVRELEIMAALVNIQKLAGDLKEYARELKKLALVGTKR